MNTSTTSTHTTVDSIVVADLVPESRRIDFMQRHFGRQMMAVEREIFAQMRDLCEDYTGGYWEFYELSNGGCFLALARAKPMDIAVHGNGFAGRMSAQAAGITATLFALSNLGFRFATVSRLSERFHQLRAYAITHAEAGLIFGAID